MSAFPLLRTKAHDCDHRQPTTRNGFHGIGSQRTAPQPTSQINLPRREIPHDRVCEERDDEPWRRELPVVLRPKVPTGQAGQLRVTLGPEITPFLQRPSPKANNREKTGIMTLWKQGASAVPVLASDSFVDSGGADRAGLVSPPRTTTEDGNSIRRAVEKGNLLGSSLKLIWNRSSSNVTATSSVVCTVEHPVEGTF